MALLIDYDNLQICAQRDAPGSALDLRSIMALAQRHGTVVVARAYAEWNSPAERLEAYKAGIEPAFAPVLRTEGPGSRDGKSLADTVMVADGVDLMWSHAPDTFVLVTSDKDLIPLALLAKRRGARVVVLGSDLTAVPLRELADEFYTYRRLIHEMTGLVLGAAQPVGRAAAERVGRPPAVGRTRTAPTPLTPAPPAPAPADERLAPPEPTPPVVDGGQEERSLQQALRRRRRRGGRGRSRAGQTASPTTMGAEDTLVVPEDVAANGADHAAGAAELAAAPAARPEGPAAAEAPPSQAAEATPAAGGEQAGEEAEPKPRPRRRRRTTKQA